jgi:hypothetical protein
MQTIQSLGLNKTGLLSISNDLAEAAIAEYNSVYGTDYTLDTAPDRLKEYLEALVVLSLYGVADGGLDKFNDDVLDLLQLNNPEYEGIDSTTQKELEDKTEISPAYVEKRVDRIIEGLAVPIFFVAHEILAIQDGRDYVGAITMLDPRVRLTHRPNHMRYWRNNGKKRPWLDYGERCVYRFGSEAQLKKLGYVNFKT